jgi:dihydropyrimidinase
MFDAPRQAAEIAAVAATGVRSFKVFLAYAAQGWMTTDADLVAVMRATRDAGGLLLVHCENGPAIDVLERDARAGLLPGDAAGLIGRTRPPILEAEAVHRVAALAQAFDARVLVVHVTSRRALEAVADARRGGARIVAETCPQYLALTEESLSTHGALAKIGPPLRTADDRVALWEGLRTGELQTIGSDHVPKKTPEDASTPLMDASFGAPSIETMLPVLFHLGVAEGRISLERFVEITSENPARAFGLWPQKGAVAVGSDADLVLWDPDGHRVLGAAHEHTNAGYSLYEGWEVRGEIRAVIVGGVVAIRDGEETGDRAPGSGRFLATGPFSRLDDDRDRAGRAAVGVPTAG